MSEGFTLFSNPNMKLIMKKSFIFDEDGRFTGKVVTDVSEIKTSELVMRYNILLECFQTRRTRLGDSVRLS